MEGGVGHRRHCFTDRSGGSVTAAQSERSCSAPVPWPRPRSCCNRIGGAAGSMTRGIAPGPPPARRGRELTTTCVVFVRPRLKNGRATPQPVAAQGRRRLLQRCCATAGSAPARFVTHLVRGLGLLDFQGAGGGRLPDHPFGRQLRGWPDGGCAAMAISGAPAGLCHPPKSRGRIHLERDTTRRLGSPFKPKLSRPR